MNVAFNHRNSESPQTGDTNIIHVQGRYSSDNIALRLHPKSQDSASQHYPAGILLMQGPRIPPHFWHLLT